MFNKIFREKALERLATPEEFDIPVKIIKLRSWLFLILAIAVMISILLLLGFSKINEEINCTGFIVKDDHLTGLSAIRTGFIEDVIIKPADSVKLNDKLLRLVSVQDKELLLTRREIGSPNLSKEIVSRSYLFAPVEGIIFEMTVNEGDYVNIGDKLLTIQKITSADNEEFEVTGFISGKYINSVKQGASVLISPGNIDVKEYGYIRGVVKRVAGYPVSQERKEILRKKYPILAAENFNGDIFETAIKPLMQNNKLLWSSQKNPTVKLINGTLCDLKIISSHKNTLSYVVK